MRAVHGWALTVVAVILFCGGPVWALSVGSVNPGGFTSLDAVNIPLGTFAFELGTKTGGANPGQTATRAATASEPGSLALLGGGLLFMAGILRRRFTQS